MQAWRAIASAGVFCALFIVATAASAQTLQLDINSISVQAKDGGGNTVFNGPSHTGSLILSMDSDASLAAVLMDGAPASLAGTTLWGLTGQIDLLGGVITGGNIAVTVKDPLNQLFSYELGLSSFAGDFLPSLLPPHLLSGDTEAGLFSSATYGTVDVSPWHAGQPLLGAMQMWDYRPNANGFHEDVHLDLFVDVVPEPASIGLLGIPAAIALLRRRRTHAS